MQDLGRRQGKQSTNSNLVRSTFDGVGKKRGLVYGLLIRAKRVWVYIRVSNGKRSLFLLIKINVIMKI